MQGRRRPGIGLLGSVGRKNVGRGFGLADRNGRFRSRDCPIGSGRRGQGRGRSSRNRHSGSLRCLLEGHLWLQVYHLLVHRIKMIHHRAVYHCVVFYGCRSGHRCVEAVFGIAPLLPPEQVTTRQQPKKGQQYGDQPPPAPATIRVHSLRKFGPVPFRIGGSGDLFKLVLKNFIKVIVLHKHLLFGVP